MRASAVRTANRATAVATQKRVKEEVQAAIKARYAAQAAVRAAKYKAIQDAKDAEAKRVQDAKMTESKLYAEKIYASITGVTYYFSGKHMDISYITYTLTEQNGEMWFVKRNYGQRSKDYVAFPNGCTTDIEPQLETIINSERLERGLSPYTRSSGASIDYIDHPGHRAPIMEKKLIRPAPISPLVAANAALKEQIAQLNTRIETLQRTQNGGDTAQLLQQLSTLNTLLSR